VSRPRPLFLGLAPGGSRLPLDVTANWARYYYGDGYEGTQRIF